MKRVLIFGGAGLVGSRFIELSTPILEINSPSANQADILNRDQISKATEEFNPDIIINFAAYTNVEEAEKQKGDRDGICFKVNAMGAKNVAEIAKKFDKHLIHISTEYVFDGTKKTSPYVEEDKPNPVNWYGVTKWQAEELILDSDSKSTIVRISMPFSANYELKKDVARFFLTQLKDKKLIEAIKDQLITPTLVDDIANALVLLLNSHSLGIYHICSKDYMTPLEFAKTIAKTFKLDYSLVGSIALEEFNRNKKAKMLKYSWLNPAKFEKRFGDQVLHTIEEALVIFKQEINPDRIGVDQNL